MTAKTAIVLRASCAILVWALALLVHQHLPANTQSSRLDAAHQRKLLSLLDRHGFESNFDKDQAALLGIPNSGQHIATRKVQFYSDKDTLLYAFSRVDGRASGYFFFFDPERDNPNSAALAFRTDRDFKLMGGIEWVDGKPTRLSPPQSAGLFAEQMRNWVNLIDRN